MSDNRSSMDLRQQIATLLAELYGGNGAPINALSDRVLSLIDEQRAVRPPELQEFDQRTAPNWYASAETIAYVLYVDLFCPEAAPGHVLEAFLGEVGYLRELGVNLLHILPIMRSSGDAGFAVDDFEQVDARFGTVESLQEVIRACHQHGIRLVLDFVLNHVSTNHAWAVAARNNDPFYSDFFIWNESGEPWPGVPDIFPNFAPGHWDYVVDVGKWVWATFYKRQPMGAERPQSEFGQWDLNYKNPEVLLSMLRHLLHVANWGIDVFRLDAVPYLWKEHGTPCVSLPQVHIILRLIRVVLQAVSPRVALLAEANRPFEQIIDYFGTGDEVQMAYHFTLMPALWRAVALGRGEDLREVLNKAPRALDRAYWWVFSEVHDELTLEMVDDANARIMAHDFMEAGGLPFRQLAHEDFPRGIAGTTFTVLRGDMRRILLIWQLQLSLGWTPLFYMGAELGVENDYSYQGDPALREDSRFAKRVALDAARKKRRHDVGSKEAYLFHNLRRFMIWRKQHSCLIRPPDFFETGSSRVIGYTKQDTHERMVILANCSDDQETITVPWLGTKTLRPLEFWSESYQENW